MAIVPKQNMSNQLKWVWEHLNDHTAYTFGDVEGLLRGIASTDFWSEGEPVPEDIEQLMFMAYALGRHRGATFDKK